MKSNVSFGAMSNNPFMHNQTFVEKAVRMRHDYDMKIVSTHHTQIFKQPSMLAERGSLSEEADNKKGVNIFKTHLPSSKYQKLENDNNYLEKLGSNPFSISKNSRGALNKSSDMAEYVRKQTESKKNKDSRKFF